MKRVVIGCLASLVVFLLCGVASAQLSDDEVQSQHIQDGAVTRDKIANGAVTYTKIKNYSVGRPN